MPPERAIFAAGEPLISPDTARKIAGVRGLSTYV